MVTLPEMCSAPPGDMASPHLGKVAMSPSYPNYLQTGSTKPKRKKTPISL